MRCKAKLEQTYLSCYRLWGAAVGPLACWIATGRKEPPPWVALDVSQITPLRAVDS